MAYHLTVRNLRSTIVDEVLRHYSLTCWMRRFPKIYSKIGARGEGSDVRDWLSCVKKKNGRGIE